MYLLFLFRLSIFLLSVLSSEEVVVFDVVTVVSYLLMDKVPHVSRGTKQGVDRLLQSVEHEVVTLLRRGDWEIFKWMLFRAERT